MSKYTKEQVIKERKCGLKFFDRAVAKAGIDFILLKTIEISKRHPDTWDPGWSNVDWAFGNAWRDIIDYAGPDTANLDECLTEEQMQYLAKELGFKLEDYSPTWKRSNKPYVEKNKSGNKVIKRFGVK